MIGSLVMAGAEVWSLMRSTDQPPPFSKKTMSWPFSLRAAVRCVPLASEVDRATPPSATCREKPAVKADS